MVGGLQRESKDRHDAIHSLVLPAHGAAAICVVIPEARRRRVETGAIFLHYSASYWKETNIHLNTTIYKYGSACFCCNILYGYKHHSRERERDFKFK